jgi:hypothetical protein
LSQGELEHRNPKARFCRTSKKKFTRQLAQIERRQARIRAIRLKLSHNASLGAEPVLNSPDAHHHIGVAENHPIHIGSFLRSHTEDPAVKVKFHIILQNTKRITSQQNFWSKLKKHLLPRIKNVLDIERQARNDLTSSNHSQPIPALDDVAEVNGIHFKGDRMYQHHIMRINFTTYDVRRGQDTINPRTDHNNIMLLASQDATTPNHEYIYARVLGIFHVNVVYSGPGMLDYRARRMEFLWVRYYQNLDNVSEPVNIGWANAQLDRLEFPPMSEEDSFGFIDPAHVLRSCHLVPKFAAGMRHPDGHGISECARDVNDWHQYYVLR